MPKMVDKYHTNFLENRDKPYNSSKAFSLYWSFIQICFEVCQTPQSNFVSDTILVQVLRMPNFLDEY